MRISGKLLGGVTALVCVGALTVTGCYSTPIDVSDQGRGPVPLRMPYPGSRADGCNCYEDSLTGGQVFAMYCGYCHNAPALAERPFSSYQNVALHMRDRANLTGKEYAKLMEFLRRWHDVPQPNPPTDPSPKRLMFSLPIAELQKAPGAAETAPKPREVEAPAGKAADAPKP